MQLCCRNTVGQFHVFMCRWHQDQRNHFQLVFMWTRYLRRELLQMWHKLLPGVSDELIRFCVSLHRNLIDQSLDRSSLFSGGKWPQCDKSSLHLVKVKVENQKIPQIQFVVVRKTYCWLQEQVHPAWTSLVCSEDWTHLWTKLVSQGFRVQAHDGAWSL